MAGEWRGFNKFMLYVGIVAIMCLLYYGYWLGEQEQKETKQKYPSMSNFKFFQKNVAKMFIFTSAPFLSFIGLLLILIMQVWPSIFRNIDILPLICLFPTIITLAYFWLISIFQMFTSIMVLTENIELGQSWIYMGFYIMKCLFLFLTLLMYLVLIQIIHGFCKIAAEIDSRTPRTQAPPLLQPNPRQQQLEYDNDIEANVILLSQNIS